MVSVRKVEPADWATYREVRLAALADSPEAFASSLEGERALDEEAWRQRLGSADSFLAWLGGVPVGAATGLRAGSAVSQSPDLAGAWQLVAMWVSPAARRAGVGGQLVEAVLERAGAAGAPSVVLWVFAANARARAFYQRLGFRDTEHRLTQPDRPGEIEIMMIRDLG